MKMLAVVLFSAQVFTDNRFLTESDCGYQELSKLGYVVEPGAYALDIRLKVIELAMLRVMSAYDPVARPTWAVGKTTDGLWVVRFTGCHDNSDSGGIVLFDIDGKPESVRIDGEH